MERAFSVYGMSTHGSITLSELSYRGRGFGPVDLVFPAGELTWLCGPSGAGKSTLCGLLAHRYDPTSGRVENPEGSLIGYVAQDFENQLLGANVEQELEIGRRGGQGQDSATPPDSLVELFAYRLGDDPHQLSAGMQQLLLVTSLLLSQAQVLILDESLSLLDWATQEMVLKELRSVCESGFSVILVSHDLRILPYVDRVVGMNEGRLAFDVPSEQLGWPELQTAQVWPGSLEPSGDSEQVLGGSVQSSSWGFQAFTAEPDGLDLGHGICLSSGQIVALSGASGSGKSRVLSALCGLEQMKDWLAINEVSSKSLLRQRAEASLWHDTVRAELESSQVVGGGKETPSELGVPTSWLERSPKHLSNGQARFLAATCLLLQRPELLLMDDPFAGLDRSLRQALRGHLERYLADGGRCLLVSHHADEVVLYTSRLIMLQEGLPHWSGPVDEYKWSEDGPIGQPLGLDTRFVG